MRKSIKSKGCVRRDCRGREVLGNSCQKPVFCFQLTAIPVLWPQESTQHLVFVCKQTHICPFQTSESHAKWPCISVWDWESGHCLLCGASDVIAANLLTGLLCRELPEETVPLYMNLSGGQLEGYGFVTACRCALWVCCFALQAQIMFNMMAFSLALRVCLNTRTMEEL